MEDSTSETRKIVFRVQGDIIVAENPLAKSQTEFGYVVESKTRTGCSANGYILFPNQISAPNYLANDWTNNNIFVNQKIGFKRKWKGIIRKCNGVAVDSFGNVHLSDYGNCRIQVFSVPLDLLSILNINTVSNLGLRILPIRICQING